MTQMKLLDFYRLMRFDKPAGTILLLWPTLWALVLASRGWPTFSISAIFIFGVIIMRAAGCIINDTIDKDFDRHVVRTQTRPMATGKITVKEAGLLLVVLLLCAFGLVLCLNRQSQLLAVVGLFLTVLYPFTKRFFSCPQLVLGIVWSISILMAFTAVTGHLSILAFVLYFAHLSLTMAYDTMYAMTDKQDDIKLGLHSLAITVGDREPLYIALLQLMALSLFVVTGVLAGLTWAYWCAIAMAASLMCYQQYLIQLSEQKGLQAFLNNQWLGAILLLGMLMGMPCC